LDATNNQLKIMENLGELFDYPIIHWFKGRFAGNQGYFPKITPSPY
jgi:hypothetical protein